MKGVLFSPILTFDSELAKYRTFSWKSFSFRNVKALLHRFLVFRIASEKSDAILISVLPYCKLFSISRTFRVFFGVLKFQDEVL